MNHAQLCYLIFDHFQPLASGKKIGKFSVSEKSENKKINFDEREERSSEEVLFGFQIVQALPVSSHYHGYQRIDYEAQAQIRVPNFITRQPSSPQEYSKNMYTHKHTDQTLNSIL